MRVARSLASANRCTLGCVCPTSPEGGNEALVQPIAQIDDMAQGVRRRRNIALPRRSCAQSVIVADDVAPSGHKIAVPLCEMWFVYGSFDARSTD